MSCFIEEGNMHLGEGNIYSGPCIIGSNIVPLTNYFFADKRQLSALQYEFELAVVL